VLLLVPLLLASRTPASTLYACASMGSVQAECCCPHSASEQQTSISRSCCCELRTFATALPSASLRSESPAPVLVARWFEPGRLERLHVIEHVSLSSGVTRVQTVESRAGPSFVILHRRLLI
jgi:hypothetical protein